MVEEFNYDRRLLADPYGQDLRDGHEHGEERHRSKKATEAGL